MSYLKNVGTRQTPSNERVPGRSDQVENSAGGYVFSADKWSRFDRFLVMGSEKGTYYVGERELTLQNVTCALGCLAEDGERAVKRIVEISVAGRAPSNDPALYVLAMATAAPSMKVRALALEALPKVARIGTHLFHFWDFVKNFRGRGRSLNRAVRSWYEDMDLERLAFQIVKYKQRDGWSHRDILRLVKPVPDSPERDAVFAFAVGKATGEKIAIAPAVIGASVRAHIGMLSAQEICALRVPREALPSESLAKKDVWAALLKQPMPIGAMVRNLGKMSSIGIIKPLSSANTAICERLRDAEAIAKSRIHPLQILAALATYRGGQGFRGSLTWTVSVDIVDALNDAYDLSFANVEPTGLRTLVALDVSGSMGSPVNGMPTVSCRVAAAAMATIVLRTESKTHTIAFTAKAGNRGGWRGEAGVVPVAVSGRSTIQEIIDRTAALPFGSTDCALPMVYAKENALEVDAFHVYTDNEHWAGKIHPFQALADYRASSGINAKLVVWAMAANEFSIADPNDPGMLDVVGLDSGAPAVVNEWLKG